MKDGVHSFSLHSSWLAHTILIVKKGFIGPTICLHVSACVVPVGMGKFAHLCVGGVSICVLCV